MSAFLHARTPSRIIRRNVNPNLVSNCGVRDKSQQGATAKPEMLPSVWLHVKLCPTAFRELFIRDKVVAPSSWLLYYGASDTGLFSEQNLLTRRSRFHLDALIAGAAGGRTT